MELTARSEPVTFSLVIPRPADGTTPLASERMPKMTYRIRIRICDVEVEYEGSSAPDKAQVIDVLTSVSAAYREIRPQNHPHDRESPLSSAEALDESVSHADNIGTIDNIIGLLEYDEIGSDLVAAAAIHLTLVKHKTHLSRNDIHEVIKTSSHHKKTFASNLTAYLKTALNKKRINETKTNVYVLAPAYRREVEQALDR